MLDACVIEGIARVYAVQRVDDNVKALDDALRCEFCNRRWHRLYLYSRVELAQALCSRFYLDPANVVVGVEVLPVQVGYFDDIPVNDA